MSKKIESKHWYDGWIYAKFIDTNFFPIRNKILDYIDNNKTVLDVGCGTGGFTLEIAKKSKHVVGIDVSNKQIQEANKRLNKTKLNNAEFIHVHASHIEDNLQSKFDYAVFSFMLHEIPQEERLSILKEIRKIANVLIILEYNVPHPYNFWGMLTRFIEFIAGCKHFTNFIDFQNRGGINKILAENDIVVAREKINRKGIFKIVVSEKFII